MKAAQQSVLKYIYLKTSSLKKKSLPHTSQYIFKKSWTKCSQLESQNKTRLDRKCPWQKGFTNTHQPHKKNISHRGTCGTKNRQSVRTTKTRLSVWKEGGEKKRGAISTAATYLASPFFCFPLTSLITIIKATSGKWKLERKKQF